MVTGPICDSRFPIINVDVFDLYASGLDCVRNEQMVKLFVVLIKHVCVSFDWRQISNFIDIREDVIEWSKNRTSHEEFIAIPTNNHVCVFVLRENSVDKILLSYIGNTVQLQQGRKRTLTT